MQLRFCKDELSQEVLHDLGTESVPINTSNLYRLYGMVSLRPRNSGERPAGRAELLAKRVLAKCSVRRNWYRSLSTSLVPPWYLLGTSLVPHWYLRKASESSQKIQRTFRQNLAKFGNILENLRTYWQKLAILFCKF